MDYTEIINKAAEEYCSKNELEDESDGYTYACNLATESTRAFIAGLNSPIAKQITEIEKLEAKIGAYKEIAMISYCSELLSQILYEERMDLEQLRDKLINELKLK